MSDSVLPPKDNRNHERDFLDLLRESSLDWHLDDELIDAIEHFAPSVEEEQDIKHRLLDEFKSPPPDITSPPSSLGQYIVRARGRESLAELGTHLNVSTIFLKELEADQISWEGLIQAFHPNRLAALIAAIHADLDEFLRLMFLSPTTPAGPTLSRTARGTTAEERAELEDQIEQVTNQAAEMDQTKVRKYLDQVRSEFSKLQS